MVPYQSNRLHYNWHWWHAFGSGDIGNDGVHELDIARWGLGLDVAPSTVVALGGKYAFDDDQQFPDTQYVAFEFPDDGRVGRRKQIIFEQRIWSPYPEQGFENGNAFYGTKGMMLLSKGDGWSISGGPSRKGSASVPENHQDFLDSIREGRRSSADIEIGHASASLAHLGNIATRVGRTIHFEPRSEQIPADSEANQLVSRVYRDGHWAIPRGV
jgi:predicted dehydrogenase